MEGRDRRVRGEEIDRGSVFCGLESSAVGDDIERERQNEKIERESGRGDMVAFMRPLAHPMRAVL